MAVNIYMIYTRICVDCGKVMRNVGRRAERCPECRAVHIRVKALEASYRERTEQLIRQQEERAGAIHQGLVDDNERFMASAGTYGKGRIKEILAAQKKKQPAGVGAPAGFFRIVRTGGRLSTSLRSIRSRANVYL